MMWAGVSIPSVAQAFRRNLVAQALGLPHQPSQACPTNRPSLMTTI